ncbi:MAG: hypothetical protein HQL43_09140 [Alphaproteobacteria bacterium]|nr:hypothetical protein [Alphaproteobacteria bacterium]
MRLISFSPPVLVISLVLLGSDGLRFLLKATWQSFSLGDVLNQVGMASALPDSWMSVSFGWVLLTLGLVIGEIGLIQERVRAVQEEKLMKKLWEEAERRRAEERHADMLQRLGRRKGRILNSPA